MITQQRLKELLHYDPETGIFTWKTGRACKAVPRKYSRIRISQKLYYAHRLAWLYMTGDWPTAGVDHIDTDRSNNQWANLRSANQTINNQNIRTARKHNQTGFLGVGKNGSGFMASIRANNKRHYIGTFDTPQQAHQAYLDAKRKLHEGCTI